jgi:16S rRNA (guanine(966)-N(2))-methyltransferase RsmD
MRITTGIAKGRQVPLPKGATVRPTSDRVKQALFNILGPGGLQGMHALDLFCGSGNLGLEALSRGADLAAFCDHDRRCVEQARSLAQAFGLDGQGRCLYLPLEGLASLERLRREGRRFHLALLDPPYQSDIGPRCLAWPHWASLMQPDAWLFYEHETGKEPQVPAGMAMMRAARYGTTSLAVCRRPAEEAAP